MPPVEGDSLSVWCPRFRYDLEAYLATLGDNAPVRTLQEIIDSGRFIPTCSPISTFSGARLSPQVTPNASARSMVVSACAPASIALMSEHNLDALAYPSWSNPPRLIGDMNSPHGDNSQHISPHTGFPAITVPMGYVANGLPVGLQFVGRAFAEPTLIRLAYGYEQATQHRRAPPSTPPLN